MINGLLVFLAGCSYGFVSIFLKLAYGAGFQADEVVGAQFFTGWIILLVLTLLFSRRKVDFKTMISLMLVGSLNGLTGIFYSEALELIPASLGIVITFQFAWIVILVEAMVDRQWPSRDKLWAIPLLVIGTVMAGGVLEGEASFSLLGCALAFLSAITFAFFIFFSGRLATHVPAVSRTLWLITGVMVLILFVYPPRFLTSGALTKGLSWYGLALALVAVVLPTLLLAKGVPQVGPGMASILTSSELPVTIIVAALILREPISHGQWLGVILILAGLCFPYYYEKRKFGKPVQEPCSSQEPS